MPLRGRLRHEEPAIDEAALVAARAADAVLGAARQRGSARWEAFMAPYPDLLRDAPPADLRPVARRIRAAFGPKDSIVDVVPWDECITLRDAIDALLKALARAEAGR